MKAHEGVLSLAAPASSPPTTPSPPTAAPCPLYKGFPVLHLQPQAGHVKPKGFPGKIQGEVMPACSCGPVGMAAAWHRPAQRTSTPTQHNSSQYGDGLQSSDDHLSPAHGQHPCWSQRAARPPPRHITLQQHTLCLQVAATPARLSLAATVNTTRHESAEAADC